MKKLRFVDKGKFQIVDIDDEWKTSFAFVFEVVELVEVYFIEVASYTYLLVVIKKWNSLGYRLIYHSLYMLRRRKLIWVLRHNPVY